MTEKQGWAGFASRIYYTLGGAFYVKEWLGGLGILTLISTYFLAHKSLFLSILTAVSGIGCLASMGMLLSKAAKKRLGSANPLLKVIRVEEVYEVLGNDHYRSSRIVQVEAASDGADHYDDKFFWTGSGATVPKVIAPTIQRARRLMSHRVPIRFFAFPFHRLERRTD